MQQSTVMRVLVVEDDRSVRETLGIVLETYRYQADLLDSGEKALVYLEKTWPEVLLLDLSLEGMSGEEFYEKALQKFGRVPATIVLSAVQHGEQRMHRLKGARFLAKPYSLDQLVEVIQQVASEKSAA